MEDATHTQLQSMARSLHEHISLANQLNLSFAAQLLAMAVMEITINIHGISPQEVDALCERIEERPSGGGKPAVVSVSSLRSRDRRPRARRN
jgi:hypothetical protein